MTKYTQIGGEMIPFRSSFVSGTAAACGTASTEVAIPATANSALIQAAGGAIYYEINGASAGTTSSGYVATNMQAYVQPLDNFASLYVAGEAASVAHIQFYAD